MEGLGSLLGASLADLQVSWVVWVTLGAVLGLLEVILEPLGAVLGPLGVVCWRYVGTSLFLIDFWMTF